MHALALNTAMHLHFDTRETVPERAFADALGCNTKEDTGARLIVNVQGDIPKFPHNQAGVGMGLSYYRYY